jgi:hypothetical protein
MIQLSVMPESLDKNVSQSFVIFNLWVYLEYLTSWEES